MLGEFPAGYFLESSSGLLALEQTHEPIAFANRFLDSYFGLVALHAFLPELAMLNSKKAKSVKKCLGLAVLYSEKA
ncbi:MAG: hypothetical protein LKI42_02285 [Bacteroidales bacterium]|nr:hypothetical protein [Bacteroidales bacterium]MCI1784924.1 hypothetical protein [Bacteroidales bacterium]